MICIGLLLYLLVDRVVSRYQVSPTYSGSHYSTPKKQLLSSQTKVPLHVRCYQGLLSCLRISPSSYSLVQKHLTRVVLSLVIILELLPVLLLVPLFVVCLLIYFFSMSLLLLKTQLSSILQPIQLYLRVKIQKLSSHPLPTESETSSKRSGQGQYKE